MSGALSFEIGTAGRPQFTRRIDHGLRMDPQSAQLKTVASPAFA
jgi:hypothetical protein